MFAKADFVWVDADMLLIRPLHQGFDREVIALERAGSVCGAIMRFSPGCDLTALIEATESKMDRELIWGETGPKLLTKQFGIDRVRAHAFEPPIFFPIGTDDIWKILLPEYREECEGLADQAVGLHLWNNIIDEMGYWKAMAPPAGSFLHALLAADGSDRFFRGEYPNAVVHQLVRNFRLRKNGGDLGIKQIVRQFFPSMKRTWKHYYG